MIPTLGAVVRARRLSFRRPAADGPPTCAWCGYRGDALDFSDLRNTWACRSRVACLIESIQRAGVSAEDAEDYRQLLADNGIT